MINLRGATLGLITTLLTMGTAHAACPSVNDIAGSEWQDASGEQTMKFTREGKLVQTQANQAISITYYANFELIEENGCTLKFTVYDAKSENSYGKQPDISRLKGKPRKITIDLKNGDLILQGSVKMTRW